MAAAATGNSVAAIFACGRRGRYGPCRNRLRRLFVAPKLNPAKLNPLQLKTLTLLQVIARIPGAAQAEADGAIRILQFPHAHGDHFHLGDHTVATSDATGLENQNVWSALTRKGLIRSEWPHQIALTAQGLAYETGMAGRILHGGGHHQ
jgi:hypothetical protein